MKLETPITNQRRAAILTILADGPLPRWTIQQRAGVCAGSYGSRLLAGLEYDGLIKRVGQGNQVQWALPSWQPPPLAPDAEPPQLSEPRALRKPKLESTGPAWWVPFATSGTRAEFEAARDLRDHEQGWSRGSKGRECRVNE